MGFNFLKLFKSKNDKDEVMEVKKTFREIFFEKADEKLQTLSKAEQKPILKFVKRLDSYSMTPDTKKEIYRMKPFASDKFLVEFFVDVLEEIEYPREKIGWYFDYIPFWYCIGLFILSDSEKATNFTINTAKKFLETNCFDLPDFRRIFSFIEKEEYQSIKNEIENHFILLENLLDSYKWAKNIGLGLPSNDKWYLSFELKNYDERDEEPNEVWWLDVKVYPLNSGKDCSIKLKNWDKEDSCKVYSHFDDNKINVYYKDTTYHLKTERSLQNLKAMITEIEEVFGFKFSRKIHHQFTQGKIKNKGAIQKWLSS